MWKYTSYLIKGLSHERSGTNCQDNVLVREDEYCIVAALADGLGSLRRSEVASSTAIEAVWNTLSQFGAEKIPMDNLVDEYRFKNLIIQSAAKNIREKMGDVKQGQEDMDCTLTFVYISKVHNYALTGLLGDSAICVIRKSGSVALNDGGFTANGTFAVLDHDAVQNMNVRLWNIENEEILGFILTSDGLDNEVYVKGSSHVNKTSELYFNALMDDQDPRDRIRQRIGELTEYPESMFEDDISIAILSRATEYIEFQNDPTWLCTCGARNLLHNTYCANCDTDFTLLYQHVTFGEYGGKTSFFQKINETPKWEYELLGMTPMEGNEKSEDLENEIIFSKTIAPELDVRVTLPSIGTGHDWDSATENAATRYADGSERDHDFMGYSARMIHKAKIARNTSDTPSNEKNGAEGIHRELAVKLIAGICASCVALCLLAGSVIQILRLKQEADRMNETILSLNETIQQLYASASSDEETLPVQPEEPETTESETTPPETVPLEATVPETTEQDAALSNPDTGILSSFPDNEINTDLPDFPVLSDPVRTPSVQIISTGKIELWFRLD